MNNDDMNKIKSTMDLCKEIDDLKNKIADLEEYNQQLQSMKIWSDKAEAKVKADAIREALRWARNQDNHCGEDVIANVDLFANKLEFSDD